MYKMCRKSWLKKVNFVFPLSSFLTSEGCNYMVNLVAKLILHQDKVQKNFFSTFTSGPIMKVKLEAIFIIIAAT